MLTRQPLSLPVTAAPTMDTLPPVTASIAACSTVAVRDDDRLVQSLKTGPVPRDEKSFDRSKSEPSDTDGSVKSKPMPKGVFMWCGEGCYV